MTEEERLQWDREEWREVYMLAALGEDEEALRLILGRIVPTPGAVGSWFSRCQKAKQCSAALEVEKLPAAMLEAMVQFWGDFDVTLRQHPWLVGLVARINAQLNRIREKRSIPDRRR